MNSALRVRNTIRGLLQSYGTPTIKRYLWNNEFASGRWDGCQAETADCAYPIVEKYARGGSILDLGCGEGRAANELDATKYRRYVGVDVSDVALEAARTRARDSGRSEQHHFVQSDIVGYVPDGSYDVILFMESIYYVPWARIPAMLARYSRFLAPNGVFIVRLFSGSNKYSPIADLIQRRFHVLHTQTFDNPSAVVIVFRSAASHSNLYQEAQ